MVTHGDLTVRVRKAIFPAGAASHDRYHAELGWGRKPGFRGAPPKKKTLTLQHSDGRALVKERLRVLSLNPSAFSTACGLRCEFEALELDLTVLLGPLRPFVSPYDRCVAVSAGVRGLSEDNVKDEDTVQTIQVHIPGPTAFSTTCGLPDGSTGFDGSPTFQPVHVPAGYTRPVLLPQLTQSVRAYCH